MYGQSSPVLRTIRSANLRSSPLRCRATGVLTTSKAPILELAVKRKGSDTSIILYTSSGAIDALGERWMLLLYDVLPPTAEQQHRVQEHADMLEKRRSMCASNNQHWKQLAVDECAARNTTESTDKRSPSIGASWARGRSSFVGAPRQYDRGRRQSDWMELHN